MDYGKPTKAVTGFAALSFFGQAGIILGAFLFVIFLVWLIRKLWRKNKKPGDK